MENEFTPNVNEDDKYTFSDMINGKYMILEDYTFEEFIIAVLATHPHKRAKIDNDYDDERTVLVLSEKTDGNQWSEFVGTIGYDELQLGESMISNGDYICDGCYQLFKGGADTEVFGTHHLKYCEDCNHIALSQIE